MEKNNIWNILEIEESKDQQLIKDAYRKKLVYTNPEDDAQEFMKLRNAFEEAMRLSTKAETEEEVKEKNDIDLWLDDVDIVYSDIYKRLDISLWEELFCNPVCVGLDTYLEAREKIITYLMDNYYLPHEIWILLDKQFYIVKDKEDLIQIFPKNFIDYAIAQIQNYVSIDLRAFIVGDNRYVDDYIRSYYSIKRTLDAGKATDSLLEEFNKIDRSGIYNPAIDAERIRYLISMDKKDEILNIIPKLSEYLEDDYIAFYLARAYWTVEQLDEAASIWGKLIERNSKHYGACVGMIEYNIYKGKYREANEMANTLLRTYDTDEIQNLLIKSNKYLIIEYEEILKKNPEDLKIKEELAWCYYQNLHLDECISLLIEFPESSKKEDWFLKLQTYVYGSKKDFKQALKCAFDWLENLKSGEINDESKRSIRICNQLIGTHYIDLKEYDNAISYFKTAISSFENPSNFREKLYNKERLAYVLHKSGDNESCIDVCDDILSEDSGYYPAYLRRQEAYFDMKNGQGVIDNYFGAIDIYPGYFKPYLLAEKVYYFYGQYDDAISVYERAKEANIFDKELELYYAKCLRQRSNSKETTKEALEVLMSLLNNMNTLKSDFENNDSEEFNNIGEVYHEISKVYTDMGQHQEAFRQIKEAIVIEPENKDFLASRAYICMDLEDYDEAIDILVELINKSPEDEYINICLGRCYDRKNKAEDSLKYFKKALEINAENVEALEKIGNFYIDKYNNEENVGYYNTAISYGERILEIIQNCYYYVHVGIMYEQGYEFEKSLECYKKAIECDSENIWAYNNTGYVYKLMKRYDEAIASYKRAIELMKSDNEILPYRNLATCYEIVGKYDEAMECYNKVLANWPDHVGTHERVADLLVNMGKIEEAEDMYILTLIGKYDYSKEDTYRKLMWHFSKCDNIGTAKHYASRLFLIDGILYLNSYLPPNISYDNLLSAGRFYYSIGKFNRAMKILKSVAKEVKDKQSYTYIMSCVNIAYIFFEKGNKEKAKTWANKALEAILSKHSSVESYLSYKPYKARNSYHMGMISILLGDLDKASDYLNDAIMVCPCRNCKTKDCFEGFYGLGRLYEELKEYDKAEEFYKKAIEYDADPLYIRHKQAIKDKKNGVKKSFFDKWFK